MRSGIFVAEFYRHIIVFHCRVALLEDVQQIAAETDCQAGYIAKGISMACFYYGRCLHEGHGIQKDPTEAKKLYSKVSILILFIVALQIGGLARPSELAH